MLADLVEQQTTTTGTGTYTISGSVTGRRTFADALATNDVVPYVCTDDAGNFECGLGTWNDAGTLARTVVQTSSNANAAVNWTAGTKRIYLATHSGVNALAQQKHNIEASAAPTVNDDAADGYGVGSLWVWAQTGGGGWIGQRGVWICADATVGSAVWFEILAQNYYSVSQNEPKTYITGGLVDRNSWGPYAWQNICLAGADYDTEGMVADMVLVPLAAKTTNATAKNMGGDGNFSTNGGIGVSSSGVYCLRGNVAAFEPATGNAKTWTVDAVIKVAGDYTTTVLSGGSPSTGYSGDAGLAAITVSVVSPAGNDGVFTISVTGEAGKTIHWSAGLVMTGIGDGE